MSHKALFAAFITAGVLIGIAPICATAQEPSFTVYASGLNGPRGLRFGPDGALYVAEAGTGGSNATVSSECQQVPGPIGPYTGGKTGTISKITSDGTQTIVASGFPSAKSSASTFLGVADVAFLDGSLYALVPGGGCSHGNPDIPAGIARVNLAKHTWTVIADVSDFLKNHPAKYTDSGDFEPDGTLYNMIPVEDRLYAIEPNHGQMLSVSKNGDIRQVIDISASQGHIVPTSLAHRDDLFFVGNLNTFPILAQSARIMTIAKHGFDDDFVPGLNGDGPGYHIVSSKAGFTTVVAVDFGPDGLPYALELSAMPDASGNPTPGMGKVVRVLRSGAIEDVVTGLSVPTGMTFGPDGYLYISNFGAAGPGAGQILRFAISPGW